MWSHFRCTDGSRHLTGGIASTWWLKFAECLLFFFYVLTCLRSLSDGGQSCFTSCV
ncbi:hypothetical protein CSUI_011190 [Cystoisospora suis]|uniref:Transmembrane protein n=1 Tax=Cystoisospora suis TaxID=483139 RepID=A0A2C6KCB0_9APIC|nr:hypothetical protein CSUI_011190 [Cystoisospora suis]